jgi:hypothetical protein
MRHFTPFLLLLFAARLFAQVGSISGQVIDAETGQALEFAHVFIGHTTIGVSSDVNGDFIMEGVPTGEFDLVASFVGYELYTKRIQVTTDQKINVLIMLIPQAVKLGEVKVIARQDRDWNRMLKRFTGVFLGDGSNSRHCSILNPWVIDFNKDARTTLNIATADEPIEILNDALG